MSQIGLSRAVGKSGAYVAQIEAGRLNPSTEGRAALAAKLATTPDVLFAGFPVTEAAQRDELRAMILKRYDAGRSDEEIGAELGMPPATVTNNRLAAGRKGRPNLATLDRGRKATITAAAKNRGLAPITLRKAIENGVLPISVERVALDFGRHGFEDRIEEAELDAALAKRPRCGYELCDRPALAASGMCSGAHARALECRGPWWATDEGRDYLERLASGELQSSCWICTAALDVAPAHAARAWRAKRRHVCEDCAELWLTALASTRWIFDRARPENPLHDANAEAVRRMLPVANRFKDDVEKRLPKRRGAPRKWAEILIVEVMYQAGFRDEGIRLVLDSVTSTSHASRYVTILRQRAGIRRRAA